MNVCRLVLLLPVEGLVIGVVAVTVERQNGHQSELRLNADEEGFGGRHMSFLRRLGTAIQM